jgi:hypothetical protein
MTSAVSFTRSGEFELLVAEVGNELEGSAQGGDEAVRTSWVDTSPLSGETCAWLWHLQLPKMRTRSVH